MKRGRVPHAVYKAREEIGLMLDYDGQLLGWENYADDFNRSLNPDRDFSDVMED